MKLTPWAVASMALALGGCASFSQDGGIDAVSLLASEGAGQPLRLPGKAHQEAETRTELERLLRQPLGPDDAVRIALLNNRGLRASLAGLGIAEADLVQAGRIANPGFHFSRLSGGGETEIERGVIFDLVGLLSMPLRRDIEARRFESAKLLAASSAVRLALDTRKAWYGAVAANESARYAQQVVEAAEASAELAARMAKVGNLSALDQAREQAFSAEAKARLARAAHAATAAREQLVRLMGLAGTDTGLKLPERLPELPESPRQPSGAEAQALQHRLDLRLAQHEAQATARALGLSKATGFVNVFNAGYANSSKTGAARENGYEIELSLPLFDWGGARVAKAEAIYMQSVHRTAEIAVNARSQVRQAYSAYRSSWEAAKLYRDELVPLRKKISQETLLRYNGMLVSVFELLADARSQVAGVNAAIEAQRDFWIADTELQAAISGAGGALSALPGPAPAPAPEAPAH